MTLPTQIPDILLADAQLAVARMCDGLRGDVKSSPRQGACIPAGVTEQQVLEVFACSPFIAGECQQEPVLLEALLVEGVSEPRSPEHYKTLAAKILQNCEDEEDLMAGLRRWRRDEMIRIAWRDLSGLASTTDTLHNLSDFADSCIEVAVQFATRRQQLRYGQPLNDNGEQQELIVMCMGKLGGRELNFSSDIDLILCYPEAGETNGERSTSNEEFFRKVALLFFKLLNQSTAEGFVFRVDLRLRPFGDSGPLVMNFEGLENYYLTQGREWERYAMIKARPLCGIVADQQALTTLLRPFIYRRYLDYSVFESLRELKRKIANKVEQTTGDENLKTGYGGIREIEFIGQAFQLLRGGREPQLQTRHITQVLALLAEQKLLPLDDVDHLLAAYDFLRRAENRLQMQRDAQVHVLPKIEQDLQRLTFSMGFEQSNEFLSTLQVHRSHVNSVFCELFGTDGLKPEGDQASAAPAHEVGGNVTSVNDASEAALLKQQQSLQGVWESLPESRELASSSQAEASVSTISAASTAKADAYEVLSSAVGSEVPQKVLEQLHELKTSVFFHNLTAVAQQRVERLVPLILSSAGAHANPDATVFRMLALVRAIAGRSVYLQILIERPAALQLLTALFSRSSWIADFVLQHPIVIDELLDYRNSAELPDLASLRQEMGFTLSRLAEQDLDIKMDTLRHFKMANTMRVALAELEGHFDLMQVSSALSQIAEVSLQAVCDLLWSDLTARHGVPTSRVNGVRVEPTFAIVAYGKLGGMELGYGSDLDIVFLHNSGGDEQQTDGAKQLENMVFFGRMAQKIVHFISTLTPAGVLYEIDTRLRPNGQSGLLVSSLSAFTAYQQQEAWTWEHQALVRSRVVVGSDKFKEAYAEIRHAVLAAPRDITMLAGEVSKMRSRMVAELAPQRSDWFELKQDLGGIADIEFMVQYTVLAQACNCQELLSVTDNISILKVAASRQILPVADVESLIEAYLEYRHCVHQLALNEQKPLVPENSALSDCRKRVRDIWKTIFNN